MSFVSHKSKGGMKSKKKPPPRPPPPNFSKYKSKSTYNLNQQFENLIDWSPPNSPTVERTHSHFGGSVSSSFSSSTSSLASSKKSFECDIAATNNLWPINGTKPQNYPKPNQPLQVQYGKQNAPALAPKPTIFKESGAPKVNVPPIFGPTIIRAQVPKGKITERKQDSDLPSPPMPTVPPPSPPKEVTDVDIPFGIALYDYPATDPKDLSFQANDVVILLRRINSEWLYGRVLDREGMFPANFIDIQVPLAEDENNVTALFEFSPQMSGDLALKPGQLVKVFRRINNDWLFGESNGQTGQFPSNFVDRIPNL